MVDLLKGGKFEGKAAIFYERALNRGFVVGPFDSQEAAAKYADDNRHFHVWRVVQYVSPEEGVEELKK